VSKWSSTTPGLVILSPFPQGAFFGGSHQVLGAEVELEVHKDPREQRACYCPDGISLCPWNGDPSQTGEAAEPRKWLTSNSTACAHDSRSAFSIMPLKLAVQRAAA